VARPAPRPLAWAGLGLPRCGGRKPSLPAGRKPVAWRASPRTTDHAPSVQCRRDAPGKGREPQLHRMPQHRIRDPRPAMEIELSSEVTSVCATACGNTTPRRDGRPTRLAGGRLPVANPQAVWARPGRRRFRGQVVPHVRTAHSLRRKAFRPALLRLATAGGNHNNRQL
jgi:hypothetical protein